jgi:hypothetical protein
MLAGERRVFTLLLLKPHRGHSRTLLCHSRGREAKKRATAMEKNVDCFSVPMRFVVEGRGEKSEKQRRRK